MHLDLRIPPGAAQLTTIIVINLYPPMFADDMKVESLEATGFQDRQYMVNQKETMLGSVNVRVIPTQVKPNLQRGDYEHYGFLGCDTV
jgi:hypothetical protein